MRGACRVAGRGVRTFGVERLASRVSCAWGRGARRRAGPATGVRRPHPASLPRGEVSSARSHARMLDVQLGAPRRRLVVTILMIWHAGSETRHDGEPVRAREHTRSREERQCALRHIACPAGHGCPVLRLTRAEFASARFLSRARGTVGRIRRHGANGVESATVLPLHLSHPYRSAADTGSPSTRRRRCSSSPGLPPCAISPRWHEV